MVSDLVISKFLFAVTGLTGGIARFLNEVLLNKRKFEFFSFIAFAFISGFFGQMGGDIVNVLGKNEWAFIDAGIIGYAGTEGFAFLLVLLKKNLK